MQGGEMCSWREAFSCWQVGAGGRNEVQTGKRLQLNLPVFSGLLWDFLRRKFLCFLILGQKWILFELLRLFGLYLVRKQLCLL